MNCRFTELHCKEVICLTDGRRLGFVEDVRIELPEGRVVAVIVPCPAKLFSSGRDDFVIPWSCIRRIGPDIILADVRPEDCRVPRQRRILFP